MVFFKAQYTHPFHLGTIFTLGSFISNAYLFNIYWLSLVHLVVRLIRALGKQVNHHSYLEPFSAPKTTYIVQVAVYIPEIMVVVSAAEGATFIFYQHAFCNYTL